MIPFGQACARLRHALGRRPDILREISPGRDFRQALLRLRDACRSHVFPAGAERLDLAEFVAPYDRLTRREGFHALHDWDGKADTVNADIIPVDVLHYLIDHRGHEPTDRRALAILLDYYFVHVLSLLSLRIWDEAKADAHLDRLGGLLGELQGPGGSGQRFVDDAETLILLATAHYERQEIGYDTLLDRVRSLNERHRTRIALGHAASMGCHLRFGFEATYGRDTSDMRSDNLADYPWLCFALTTLLDAYARRCAGSGPEDTDMPRSDAIVEALFNGLSPDAGAFVGDRPKSLFRTDADARQHDEFRALFDAHREGLIAAFEPLRPDAARYSPLAFFFNFSHNVVKGIVIDALLRGRPWRFTLNDLLTGLSPPGNRGDRDAHEEDTKECLARTLMGHARASPDTIRGRLMPVIVYDPPVGRRAFRVAMEKLRAVR